MEILGDFYGKNGIGQWYSPIIGNESLQLALMINVKDLYLSRRDET